MNTNSNTCPVCGEGQLEERMDKNPVEYKGTTRDLDLVYAVCTACGSEVGDTSHTRKNKRVTTAFRKEVDGLLTGTEIRAIRKKLKLSQSDAAKLFGGGPVAFSKYEADDVTQSEAMDKLLRLASELPAAYSYLCKMVGIAGAEEPKDWAAVPQPVTLPKIGELRIVEMFHYQKRTHSVPVKFFNSTNDEFQPVYTSTPVTGGLSA